MEGRNKWGDEFVSAGPKRGRPWSTRVKLAASLFSIIVSLAAVELLLAVADIRSVPVRFTQDKQLLGGMGLEDLATSLEPDPELFWRFKSDHTSEGSFLVGVVSNRQGLREDHEIPMDKSPHQYRILFLGDSCTFGVGLSYHETFVERVEQRLQTELPDLEIECINAGVPGYSIFQGWRFFETKGKHLQPDVVVACFGWNDSETWDGMSDPQHYESWQAAQPPNLLRASGIARRLWSLGRTEYGEQSGAQKEGRPRLRKEEFRHVLATLHKATETSGAKLVLLAWGYKRSIEPSPGRFFAEDCDRETRRYADEHQIPLVDLVPVIQELAKAHSTSRLFFDDVHTTSLAHAAIAGAVAPAIIEPLAR